MKIKNKIVVTIGLCFIMLLSIATGVAAHNLVEEENIEVVFKEDSIFSNEEKHIIEASFNADSSHAQPYGLKCSLFGHDYKTEIVSVIRHKVRTAKPRCMRDTYETKICTVCSDTISTLIYSEQINCCD